MPAASQTNEAERFIYKCATL